MSALSCPPFGASMPDVLPAGLAVLGSSTGRLLAGNAGPEGMRDHVARLGPMPEWHLRPAELRAWVEGSGLTGRGGGHFPLAAKLRAASDAPGVPVIVINGTESEPASAKDRLLLTARPHLVLDGASALAAAVGSDQIIVAIHEHAAVRTPLAAALAERGPGVTASVVSVPGRYVAGESSALVSWLNGGAARPVSRSKPTAVAGIDGRPTVVSNAETASHLALIARRGPGWFREAGSPSSPGSVLLTVCGDVARPGQVVEACGRPTIGEAIRTAGGATGAPGAVLLGGYAGSWLPGVSAWSTPIDARVMAAVGTPLGCGLIGVIDSSRCGIAEAARLLAWLAGERAGQCGACTLGLPELASRFSGVADGTRGGRREQRRLLSLGESISGRGLCHLPDGAVAMMESAFVAFTHEVERHRRGRCSAPNDGPSPFPLPMSTEVGGW